MIFTCRNSLLRSSMRCSTGLVSCEPDTENPRVHLRWRVPRRKPLRSKYDYRHIIKQYFGVNLCFSSKADHYLIAVLLRTHTPLFCESPAHSGNCAYRSQTYSINSLNCMEISIYWTEKEKLQHNTVQYSKYTRKQKSLEHATQQSCTYLSRVVDSPCSRDRDRRPVSISDQIVLARHGTAKERALS